MEEMEFVATVKGDRLCPQEGRFLCLLQAALPEEDL